MLSNGELLDHDDGKGPDRLLYVRFTAWLGSSMLVQLSGIGPDR